MTFREEKIKANKLKKYLVISTYTSIVCLILSVIVGRYLTGIYPNMVLYVFLVVMCLFSVFLASFLFIAITVNRIEFIKGKINGKKQSNYERLFLNLILKYEIKDAIKVYNCISPRTSVRYYCGGVLDAMVINSEDDELKEKGLKRVGEILKECEKNS